MNEQTLRRADKIQNQVVEPLNESKEIRVQKKAAAKEVLEAKAAEKKAKRAERWSKLGAKAKQIGKVVQDASFALEERINNTVDSKKETAKANGIILKETAASMLETVGKEFAKADIIIASDFDKLTNKLGDKIIEKKLETNDRRINRSETQASSIQAQIEQLNTRIDTILSESKRASEPNADTSRIGAELLTVKPMKDRVDYLQIELGKVKDKTASNYRKKEAGSRFGQFLRNIN